MIAIDDCAAHLGDAPNSQMFLRAWLGWRGADVAPNLATVRAEDIGRALPAMMVFEVFTADNVIIRLAGTLHRDILGRELTGANAIDLAPPAEREQRIELYRAYLTYPCGVWWMAQVVRANGVRTTVHGLALPVFPKVPGKAMRMYAAFDFSGDMKSFDKHPLHVLPVPEKLSFIDIGRGAPADAP